MKDWQIKPIVGFAMLLLGATAANAQGEGGSSTQMEGLEEVVVTAQRRAESEQRAAIAIKTLTGEEVIRSDISRPGGLNNLVPALQTADAAGPYSVFYVRGVGGFAANAFSDAALAFNVDGVNIAKSSTSGFFYDLNRVEILKGPQGTLYGRNATGGAINVVTNRPDMDEFGGNVSVRVGDYSALRADAVFNMPISDRAAARFAAFHTKHDGYMEDGLDDRDDIGARLSLAFEPNDSLQIDIITDFFDQGGKLAGGTVSGALNSFVAQPSFSIDDRLGFFTPEVEAFIPTQPNVTNGRTMVPFEDTAHNDNQYWGIMANVDWSSSAGTLTIIPAYRDTSLDYTRWSSGVQIVEKNSTDQSSLEVRFASDEDRAVRYIVGAYLFQENIDVPIFGVNQQAINSFQSYTLDTNSQALFASLTFDVSDAVRFTLGARHTKDDKDFAGDLNSNTRICAAGFLQCPNAVPFAYGQLEPEPASFPPFVPQADGTFTLLRSYSVSESDSYSEPTYRAALEWDVGEQNLLYASYETGFKAGGFFFTIDDPTYRPESLDAITIGSKNRFSDNRVQLNLELYHWKYKDQHFSHLSTDSGGNLIFPTENVGEATISGIDVSFKTTLGDTTLLSVDVQYNDAEYDSFIYTTPNQNFGASNGTSCPNAEAPGAFYIVDCSGQVPPYAPEIAAVASLQKIFSLSGGGNIVGNARVRYQSDTGTGDKFLEVEEQSSYSTWDFDLTWYGPEDRYFAGAYVNNAFDETAIAFSFATPLSTFMTANLRPPRTYGLWAGVNF